MVIIIIIIENFTRLVDEPEIFFVFCFFWYGNNSDIAISNAGIIRGVEKCSCRSYFHNQTEWTSDFDHFSAWLVCGSESPMRQQSISNLNANQFGFLMNSSVCGGPYRRSAATTMTDWRCFTRTLNEKARFRFILLTNGVRSRGNSYTNLESSSSGNARETCLVSTPLTGVL